MDGYCKGLHRLGITKSAVYNTASKIFGFVACRHLVTLFYWLLLEHIASKQHRVRGPKFPDHWSTFLLLANGLPRVSKCKDRNNAHVGIYLPKMTKYIFGHNYS